jgi:hypothetical protein
MTSNWLDASSSSNRYQQMYIKGFLDISGGDFILRNHNLYVKKGDASLNGNVSIGGDLNILGNLIANFKPSSINPESIIGGVPTSTGNFANDITSGSRLFINGDASFNSKISISGNSTFSSKATFLNDISINGNVLVSTIYENGINISNKYAAMNSPTFTGTVSGITKTMVGLSSVDNTSDINKPISTAVQTTINTLAPISNPTFTGVPNAPTATYGTNTTQIATTAYVVSRVSGIVGAPPASLNTLQTIAAAINNDPSFSVNVIGKYASLTNPYFINSITTPKLLVTSDTSMNGKLALIGDASMNGNLLVGKRISEGGVLLSNKYAPIASPIFTGSVTIPGMTVITDSSMNGRLSVGNSIVEGGVLLSNKYAQILSPTFQGSVTVPTITVMADASLNGNLYIGKDIVIGGNLSVNQYKSKSVITTVSYEFIVAQDMSLNGRLFMTGDASMNDNLYVGNDSSLNGNLYVQNKTILENDVSLNKNLDLNGYMIAHNNVSVYGVINQYNTATSNLINPPTNNSTNILIGNNTGSNITTGTNSIILGNNAGNTMNTGNNNIIIGNDSNSSSSTVSNEITLGNSSITTLRCQAASITSLSDRRDKTDIHEIPVGLEFITNLNPVEFIWNTRDGSRTNIPEMGFIAQELKSTQENLGVTVPNLVNENNPDKLEASYGTLIPIIVKAMKELNELVEKQAIEIEFLKSTLSA